MKNTILGNKKKEKKENTYYTSLDIDYMLICHLLSIQRKLILSPTISERYSKALISEGEHLKSDRQPDNNP